MKKVISTFLVAAMSFCATTAKADNIGLQDAKAAAAYFMAAYTGADKLTADDVDLVYQIDNEKLNIPAVYFFNIGANGWVIMGGSSVIDPIIGYSDEGSLDIDRLPANMMWWVEGNADIVSEVQELDMENVYADHPTWTGLKDKTYAPSTKATIQLLNSKWGQGDNDTPTYNYFCPQNSAGKYSVTGCVATALAQICYYYKSPRRPTGTASYWLHTVTSDSTMPHTQLKINYDTLTPFNYELMPEQPTYRNGVQKCTDEEMHEVARLNYALGVAVKMGYGINSSGAVSQYVPNYMKKYFKFTQSSLKERSGNTDTAYISAIRNEILNGHVVYMKGASPDGGTHARHAFVCAGYNDGTNKYLMNWGWDGGGNGWFDLAANNMAISGYGYNFYKEQGAIIGMHPTEVQGVADVENTELGSPYPNPATQTVTLPFSTEVAGDLVIYSIDGKRVSSCHVQAGLGEVKVDVNGMPAGVYIYRLHSQSGKFMVR